MTIAEQQKIYRDALSAIYDEREARTITQLVLEEVLELNPLKISMDRYRLLTTDQQDRLAQILKRLLTYEPVNYILGEADFFGLKFKVDGNVLIPRPETEELVELVLQENKDRQALRIIDLGTGSGCIPISLAYNLPTTIVEGIDVSEGALGVAQRNNELNKTQVQFSRFDILKEELPTSTYDIIVSNPPYITPAEGPEMLPNVMKFEPHLALFSYDEDGLIFYRRIAQLALKALKPSGRLYFEINAANGEAVVTLLKQAGFEQIELKKDLSGRDRIVRATL